jgi:hypothetical protein
MRWSMPHFFARGAHRGALTINDQRKFSVTKLTHRQRIARTGPACLGHDDATADVSTRPRRGAPTHARPATAYRVTFTRVPMTS